MAAQTDEESAYPWAAGVFVMIISYLLTTSEPSRTLVAISTPWFEAPGTVQ